MPWRLPQTEPTPPPPGARTASHWRLWLAAAVALLVWAASADAGSIRLVDRAAATGPEVTLGEIAQLDGEDARAFAHVVVARFEPNGMLARVDHESIRRALTQVGANWALLSLVGRPECVVERRFEAPAATAPPSAPAVAVNIVDPVEAGPVRRVADHIRSEIAAQSGADAAGLILRYQREADRQSAQRPLVDGRSRVWVTPIDASRFMARVEVYGSDQAPAALEVQAFRRVEAPVATGKVARGQVIQPADLVMRSIESPLGVQPAQGVRAAVGQVAGRSIRSGDVIRLGDLRAPAVVKRRDAVLVEARAGGLLIEMVGVAMADGAVGEVIAVRRSDSRETFHAEVVGPRRARVLLGGGDHAVNTGDDRR